MKGIIIGIIVTVVGGIILKYFEFQLFGAGPASTAVSRPADTAPPITEQENIAAKHRAEQLEAARKKAADEQERRIGEQRKQLEALRQQEDEDRRREQLRRQEDDLRRNEERRRLDQQQQQMAESQRRQAMESARCRDPGNGEYTCCALGQTPELRVAAVGSGREWDVFCRNIGP